MPPQAALNITIRATLATLEGPNSEVAEGIADDEYVFSAIVPPKSRLVARLIMAERASTA
jgi:hypothetical protein